MVQTTSGKVFLREVQEPLELWAVKDRLLGSKGDIGISHTTKNVTIRYFILVLTGFYWTLVQRLLMFVGLFIPYSSIGVDWGC